jgi:hypothetical protein
MKERGTIQLADQVPIMSGLGYTLPRMEINMVRFLNAAILMMLIGASVSGADAPRPATVIEISQPIVRAGVVGTVNDIGTKLERPFRQKVTEPSINHWADLEMPPAIGEKPDPKKVEEEKKVRAQDLAKAKAYTLAGQVGEYVGWFGILRNSTSDAKGEHAELLLQHCHYDDMSDPDIQVVSIYGGGDFRALVAGAADNIPSLSLVRVYGKVSKGKDGLPEVTADYIRVWDWGLFTFMDYGIDKTNETWRAMCHVKKDDIYTPHPSADYYEAVLGKRPPAEKGKARGKGSAFSSAPD